MIYESYYWKEELFRSAQYLVSRLTAKRWTQRSFAKLEKTVMIACYSIRKLGEAQKISPDFLDRQIDVLRYQAKKKNINQFNSHRIDENYKIDSVETITITVSYLLNQIIHSFVFMPLMSREDSIIGILFNSDRSKNNHLFQIQTKDLVDIMLSISSGTISYARYQIVDGKMKFVEAIYEYNKQLFTKGGNPA